jgi:poly(A) polymerase
LIPAGRIDPQDWMTAPGARAVMTALNGNGGVTRFVGGAVRDALIGRAVTDVDLATDLKPDAAMTRLVAAGIEVVPTGLKHGTVTALTSGRHFEITTLRVDVETFGRHARVAFAADWQADAERRDFTMNALYLDADGTLYDPTGGRADLEAGRIRFVGDPATRIAEDYLRVLRFFRFQAQLGREPADARALDACRDAAPKLAGLSAERIRVELLKLLAAPDPAPTVQLMRDLGIFAPILPEATRVDLLAGMVAAERTFGEPVEPLRRLAALIDTDAPRVIADRLRLSNTEAKRLVDVAGMESPPRQDPAEMRAEIYRHGLVRYVDRILLVAAELVCVGESVAHLASVLDAAHGFSAPKLPIAGRDLVALGVPKGPAVGKLLRDAEAHWIASDFALRREALLDWARARR